MNQITEGLAVASEAEVICYHEDQSTPKTYTMVLSLGCIIPEEILYAETKYISLPNVRDECSTFMLDLWLLLRSELKSSSTLIHCQLGQSRSVSTVAAMMVLLEGWEVSVALSNIRTVRPTIAVNPSFLAQLFFLSMLSSVNNDKQSNRLKLPIFHLLRWQHQSQTMSFLADHPPLQQRFIDALNKPIQCETYDRTMLCKKCEWQLAVDGDIISVSINTLPFVEANVDEFWRPILAESEHIHCTRLPIKGLVVTRPLTWMLEKVQRVSGNNDCDILCPNESCNASVGVWRKQCLDIISPHLLCDLFALRQNAIFLRRQHHKS